MIQLFPTQAPTDYYCQSLTPVDEQLCALIARRKELSQNNPGFPPEELITAWCDQHGLNKHLMWGIFSSLYNEHHFEPVVEPAGFVKFLPVLKSVEVDQVMYTVTHLKQYGNASVVALEVELKTDDPYSQIGHAALELNISPEYKCRQNGGHSQGGGMQYTFVVTPPLPDDLTGIEFGLTVKPFPAPPEFRSFVTEAVAVSIT
jgi:hypothetical protein